MHNSPDNQINTNSPARLFYLDNIKWFMIILVVLMHLKVTYGDMGMWYYNESHATDLFSFLVFGVYGSFVQSFFMGLLFFIAGYFTPKSLDKKGLARFIGDRFVRLGIPTLIYMLIINPLILLILSHFKIIEFPSYSHYVFSLEFLRESGPLWFCFALLIFSVTYAFINLYTRNKAKDDRQFVLSNRHVLAIIALLALSTFLSRIVWPSGSHTYTLLNMQLGNFSQYIIMFALGILVYRRNVLDTIEYKFGERWFMLAFALGVPFWLAMFLAGNGINNINPYLAGIHWQSLAYAIWQSFFCMGISLGLIAIFRKKYNSQRKGAKFMSSNAFAVYVFHPLIVVYITLSFRNLILYPVSKMAIMSIIIIPICFISCYFIRKIPVMKTLFS